MNRNKLISLASSFASFLINRIEVKSIILFGSVAQNSFDKESDIYIFVETEAKNEKKIKNILELYKKTEEYEKFRLDGIDNEIIVKVGKLDEWKGLKRSIISGGIILYGNYQGKPERLKHKILFILSVGNLKRAERVKIWRKIYGYKQKIGNKIYSSSGIAERKIGKGAFIIPIEKMKDAQEYLAKNKIKHSFFDVWLE